MSLIERFHCTYVHCTVQVESVCCPEVAYSGHTGTSRTLPGFYLGTFFGGEVRPRYRGLGQSPPGKC